MVFSPIPRFEPIALRADRVSYCFECKRPLVEIDNRGQRLHGRMTCNIWWSFTGGGVAKLSVEDWRRSTPFAEE
jgi:hypothetical protein